jgi:hypothetical protein
VGDDYFPVQAIVFIRIYRKQRWKELQEHC